MGSYVVGRPVGRRELLGLPWGTVCLWPLPGFWPVRLSAGRAVSWCDPSLDSSYCPTGTRICSGPYPGNYGTSKAICGRYFTRSFRKISSRQSFGVICTTFPCRWDDFHGQSPDGTVPSRRSPPHGSFIFFSYPPRVKPLDKQNSSKILALQPLARAGMGRQEPMSYLAGGASRSGCGACG